MTWVHDGIVYVQWFFLIYFIALNGGYILLNLVSISSVLKYTRERSVAGLPQAFSSYEPPISIIVPAFNEAGTIASSVASLLQLSYPEYEIVVVDDGSRDETLDELIRSFSLEPFPEAYRARLLTRPVKAIYHSRKHPGLRVVTKENGGKADALNAGINCSRYPLICGVDADSILQRDSLQKVVQPFLEDPRTVAAGGTIRIANGCKVRGGFLTSVGLPDNFLALLQIVEYLRAFLFGRLGWSPMNALLIISGAFGLFYKERVILAGGYRSDTVGEDMELVVRLHRMLIEEKRDYRITFVPDPICWTEAPEDLGTLRNQRIRWQRGLAESLAANRSLLFKRGSGAVGWLAYPFMLLFEGVGPLIEVLGYVFMTTLFVFGWIDGTAFLAFILVAVGLGILLSASALLLEELSFHLYPKPMHVLKLFAIAIVENFGYRQLNAWWRLTGLFRWVARSKGHWGKMTRRASWQAKD